MSPDRCAERTELCISQVPVLFGTGIRYFGELVVRDALRIGLLLRQDLDRTLVRRSGGGLL